MESRARCGHVTSDQLKVLSIFELLASDFACGVLVSITDFDLVLTMPKNM